MMQAMLRMTMENRIDRAHSARYWLAGAREQYGVVIDPQSLSIDWEKTAALRHNRTEPAMAAD